jgi:hypothetical protein
LSLKSSAKIGAPKPSAKTEMKTTADVKVKNFPTGIMAYPLRFLLGQFVPE